MSVSASVPRLLTTRRAPRLLFGLIAALLAAAVGVALYLALTTGPGASVTRDHQLPGPGSQLEECLNSTGRTYC